MMKYLLILPLFVAVFMLGHVSPASAHCGTCAKSEHKMEKLCKCAGKKPCAKKKAEKKKDCKPCKESERKFQMKKKRSEIFFND